LQGGAAPRDGGPDLAGVQQVVIVFGVADPDDVVDRQSPRAQRAPQPRGFADPRRQRHQPAAVEHQHERLLLLADDLKDLVSPLRLRLDHREAGLERDAALPERLEHGCGGHLKSQDGLCAVSRDDVQGQVGPLIGFLDVDACHRRNDVREVLSSRPGDGHGNGAVMVKPISRHANQRQVVDLWLGPDVRPQDVDRDRLVLMRNGELIEPVNPCFSGNLNGLHTSSLPGLGPAESRLTFSEVRHDSVQRRELAVVGLGDLDAELLMQGDYEVERVHRIQVQLIAKADVRRQGLPPRLGRNPCQNANHGFPDFGAGHRRSGS
jgi:hypothetical protein